jgi:hypothetical protein
MALDTYSAALEFAERFERPVSILLSGGEPSEHPRFLDLVKAAIRVTQTTRLVIVATNGMFLHDSGKTEALLSLGVHVQVTNDDRYYPRRVPVLDDPRITYVDRIRVMDHHGRAAKNNIPGTRLCPTCYNLRALAHAYGFRNGLLALREARKFCQPSVDIDGAVRAGESTDCQIIGTIWDDAERLTQGIRKPCWCEAVEQLPYHLQRYFSPRKRNSRPLVTPLVSTANARRNP